MEAGNPQPGPPRAGRRPGLTALEVVLAVLLALAAVGLVVLTVFLVGATAQL